MFWKSLSSLHPMSNRQILCFGNALCIGTLEVGSQQRAANSQSWLDRGSVVAAGVGKARQLSACLLLEVQVLWMQALETVTSHCSNHLYLALYWLSCWTKLFPISNKTRTAPRPTPPASSKQLQAFIVHPLCARQSAKNFNYALNVISIATLWHWTYLSILQRRQEAYCFPPVLFSFILKNFCLLF